MMKKCFKLISALSILAINSVQGTTIVTPTYVARSQSFHGDRFLSGTEKWWNFSEDNACGRNVNAMSTSLISYSQSFNSRSIAQCFFGDAIQCDKSPATILVQGSAVENRDKQAWLADYFYLDAGFDGSFTVEPRISNVVFDFDFRGSFDKWIPGTYAYIHVPIVRTKWDMNFKECKSTATTRDRVGYFTPTGTETLLTSIDSFFAGNAPMATDGIEFEGLRFAKMTGCKDNVHTKAAEIRVGAGWDFYRCDNAHFGIAGIGAAPTGGRRNAEFAFSPVVGNGNHWEAGGNFNGHMRFWNNEITNRSFSWYFDCNLMHMFKSEEERTFDISMGPASRYQLAMNMTRDGVVSDDLGSGSESVEMGGPIGNISSQFNKKYVPVANLTTIRVLIQSSLQVDFTTFFNFQSKRFSVEFGYNMWARMCETIDQDQILGRRACTPDLPSLYGERQNDRWALKGDSQMYGFASNTTASLTKGEPIALSATQSQSNINSGANQTTIPSTNLWVDSSPLVGNAEFTYAGAADQQALLNSPAATYSEATHIRTSAIPDFINTINVSLRETRGLSHKLFMSFNYTFERDGITPFFGLGASSEFNMNSSPDVVQQGNPISRTRVEKDRDIQTRFNRCITCSPSEWSLWFKGGLTF